MLSNREQILPSYNRKFNSSRVSNALVIKQIALFVEHTIFLCDCFKSRNTWKPMFLGFVKHEHDIPDFVEHPENKGGNLSTLHA